MLQLLGRYAGDNAALRRRVADVLDAEADDERGLLLDAAEEDAGEEERGAEVGEGATPRALARAPPAPPHSRAADSAGSGGSALGRASPPVTTLAADTGGSGEAGWEEEPQLQLQLQERAAAAAGGKERVEVGGGGGVSPSPSGELVERGALPRGGAWGGAWGAAAMLLAVLAVGVLAAVLSGAVVGGEGWRVVAGALEGMPARVAMVRWAEAVGLRVGDAE